MKKKPVFRAGKVHVRAKLCSTCIFRPGNRMFLPIGTVEGMVKGATAAQSCIPCHDTTYGQDKQGEAVCRGFFNKHATAPLQIAYRMKLIEWQK